MPNCPRCQQPIKSQAVTCPHCRMVLKAYGHPGIPLHRSTGEAPLCESCTYHEDDTCTFPQRPHAKECTLYQDRSQPQMEVKPQPDSGKLIRLWLERNLIWLILVGLLIASFIISLL